MAGVTFEHLHDDSSCHARCGRIRTSHGSAATPAFMPVGTQGTVKGIEVSLLRQTGAEMILGNTYHLALRPGSKVVAQLGGLHGFSGWTGPILTDSGGFQIFSLAQMVHIQEESAIFRSHLDGSTIEWTPERAMEIQADLGSDIAMVLDHVVALPNSAEAIRLACERSIRWARRCRDVHRWDDQGLFAIVQGGLDMELRGWCAQQLTALEFSGYAIGGLSVGESPQQMESVVSATCPQLPAHLPRYLMGVGRPQDLLMGIRHGLDLFDCVMPTRNGRNAMAFTRWGTLHVRNQIHALDDRPLEEGCPCVGCQRSRGYLRHLFQAGEMLGPILVSIHNLTYYQRLMRGARESILANRFMDFETACRADWEAGAQTAQIPH